MATLTATKKKGFVRWRTSVGDQLIERNAFSLGAGLAEATKSLLALQSAVASGSRQLRLAKG